MNEKIQILDLEIDNCTAKYAMEQVIEYMGTEPLNVVEILHLKSLVKLQEETELKQQMSEFDLILAGEKGLLEATGIPADKRLHEIDSNLFLRMFTKYLHRNEMKIFILSELEEALQSWQEHLMENYPNIKIVGTAIIKGQEFSEDTVVNKINGAEADCIISLLSSPMQETFVLKNKQLLNSRLWIGLGAELKDLRQEKTRFQKVQKWLMRYGLKKEIEKERNE